MEPSIHVACAVGDMVSVLAIARAGGNLSEPDSAHRLPLHCAAMTGQTHIARYLVVDGKVDVNARSGQG